MAEGVRVLERKKISFTSVGGSSILTIFAVLCFIVFALLSLSTARADRTLADKSAEAVQNYYRADTEAEEILGRLRGGEVPEQVTKSGYNEYSYSCKIDEKQELQVKVEIQGERYFIKQWRKVYVGEWDADDSMEVFEGLEINE